MRDIIAYRVVALFAFAAVIGCTLGACAPRTIEWPVSWPKELSTP